MFLFVVDFDNVPHSTDIKLKFTSFENFVRFRETFHVQYFISIFIIPKYVFIVTLFLGGPRVCLFSRLHHEQLFDLRVGDARLAFRARTKGNLDEEKDEDKDITSESYNLSFEIIMILIKE